MALGGKGVSAGRGAGLVGSDTGLSSGIGGLQGIDTENGLHCNFVSNVHYRKVAGSPAIFSAPTSMFTVTSSNVSMIVNKTGYLSSTTTNEPRVEYRSNGTSLGVLREPARDNLCLQSSNFGTTWIVAGSSVSVNQTASPSNAVDADKLIEGAGGTFHLVRQDIAVAANTAHTGTIYIKAGERTFCRIQLSNTAESNGSYIDVNLSTGATGSVTNFGTGSGGVAYTELMPNGFYRIFLTSVIDAASTTARFQILTATALGTVNYSGDGTSGIFLYGAQLEVGIFGTSYIPTTTIPVNRPLDRYQRALSTEFVNSVGTFSVCHNIINTIGATPAIFSVHNNTITGAEEMLMYGNAAARRWFVTDGGVSQANVLGTTVSDLAYSRCASAFSVNDFHISVEGTLAASPDSAGTLPTVTHLDLLRQDASAVTAGHITKFDYWPERVNNTILRGI